MHQPGLNKVIKENFKKVLKWIELNLNRFNYRYFLYLHHSHRFEIGINVKRELSIYDVIKQINISFATDEDDENMIDDYQYDMQCQIKIVFKLNDVQDVKQKLANLEAISNQFRYEQQPLAPVVSKTQWKTYLNLINSTIHYENIIILDCNPDCVNTKIIDRHDILNKFETIINKS